jgi:hypothetical protein
MNRISSPSRWPVQPAARLERAQRDIDFVIVMVRLGFPQNSDLDAIYRRAWSEKRRLLGPVDEL